jgi:molybdopterin converting factor small subunit
VEHGELLNKVIDDSGELRSFVNVFLGSRNLRQLDGLETALIGDDVLTILPAVAGGGPNRGRR